MFESLQESIEEQNKLLREILQKGGPVVFKLLHNQRRTVIQQFNNQLKELGKEL